MHTSLFQQAGGLINGSGKRLREVEWIAHRRETVRMHVQQGTTRTIQETLATADARGRDLWTDRHEALNKKLDAKVALAQVHAYENGTLIDEDVDESLLAAVDVYREKRRELD